MSKEKKFLKKLNKALRGVEKAKYAVWGAVDLAPSPLLKHDLTVLGERLDDQSDVLCHTITDIWDAWRMGENS
tara:strand:+ start:3386 stop:3604 length:219 start_codon:yes stop_codon:yes gene_type:complete